MAVPGKFETTRKVFCGTCLKVQLLAARSLEWTGRIRTDLVCGTVGCGYVFENEKTKSRATKGSVSCRPQISLITLPGETEVVLEDYECSEGEAQQFCSMFNDVLHRLPYAAQEVLTTHWLKGCGSPHIWLLKNRKEWRGSGWAASDSQGLSLYVVSTLVGRIPVEHISTAIAHEFGHMLFIAGGEQYHCPPERTLADLIDPRPVDPLSRLRPEWLVWRLMESWGFDQMEMEAWMERNVIDDAQGIRFRDEPDNDADFQGKCVTYRNEMESKLNDMVFPAAFEKYLST